MVLGLFQVLDDDLRKPLLVIHGEVIDVGNQELEGGQFDLLLRVIDHLEDLLKEVDVDELD